MPIKVMPDALASRVAAGEVVERPSSVVKELIENSLDAGASRIDVELQGGGRSSIRVVDDGHGIPADQLGLAFERFATSKVDESSDLVAIPTLGFRGEALPSIAAVADVTAVSRHIESESGAECNVTFGSEPQVLAAGVPVGTSVTVRQLFRNVPARLKFLSSDSAEAARVATMVGQMALIRSDVKFRLVVDGAVRVNTPGDFDDATALAAVYRVKNVADLVNLHVDPGAAFRAGGAIGLPTLHFGRRSHITVAVNGRLVHSYRLTYAIERGYHGFLPDKRFPMALIKATAPLEDVDVNVHPQKTEVRFRREGLMFSVIESSVKEALGTRAPVRQFSDSRIASSLTTSLEGAFAMRRSGISPPPIEIQDDDPPTSSNGAGAPSESQERHGETARESVDEPDQESSRGGWEFGQERSTSSARHRDVLPGLRVLGQAQSTYIVAEDASGVFLIDQHAAHERVKFEEIKARHVAQSVDSQLLLAPQSVELSPQRQEIYSEGANWFADAGWDIEPFGGDSILIRAIPQILVERAAGDANGAEKAFLRVLDDVTQPGAGRNNGDSMPWSERLLATMACHAAVRAGDALTQGSCEEIVRLLQECEHPQSCPHGRPTMLLLTGEALEREFGRR
ncbi:MAG: DNA mismatch repair endonuclease MutL [Chloroflexi bacterium]|nr:DNA mismatch repair endonuclease MutL [Chloroflexota bacterium]